MENIGSIERKICVGCETRITGLALYGGGYDGDLCMTCAALRGWSVVLRNPNDVRSDCE